MKKFSAIAVFLGTIYMACTDSNAKYIDLNTGKEITIEKDSSTGYAVNGESHEPVRFYVNTVTKDTIDGRTGEVIRKRIIRRDNGVYVYADDVTVESSSSAGNSSSGEMKIKDGDYKKKVDDDGSVKIKDGDTKIKIDENGNKKVKRDD